MVFFVPVTQKVIAVSFDDGPNDPYTGQILDILKREDAKATFFLVGENAGTFPDTARRIHAEGHAVGNHSFSHPRLDELTAEQIETEILHAGEAIAKAAGVQPTLFRAPYGFYGTNLDVTCRKHQYVMAAWTGHAGDWNPREPADMANDLMNRACPGCIFLLHDGKETIHSFDRSATVRTVELLVQDLKARGYRLVTIPELLAQAQPPVARFANGAELLGWQMPDAVVHAGDSVPMRFFWNLPEGFDREKWNAFVHVRQNGTRISQADHKLPSGANMWELVADAPAVLSKDAQAGPCDVEVGLYPPGQDSWRARARPETDQPVRQWAVVFPSAFTITP